MGKAGKNEIRDWQGFCRNDCGNTYFSLFGFCGRLVREGDTLGGA